MNQNEQAVKEAAAADHAYVVSLRRWLHQHPELSGHEDGTAARIEQELSALGLVTRRIGRNSVIADIRGNQPGKKIILLRADIDALPIAERHDCEYRSLVPGVMHACGHDGHIAGLVGAARILTGMRDCFGGTVRLVFEEAEELGHGSLLIAQSEEMKGVGRTFGIHMAPDVPVGSIVLMPGSNNAGVDWLHIHVTGRSAHVCTPEKGVDAAYIASAIVVNLQALITRMCGPMEPVLVSVNRITAGTAYNVIAAEADLEGTLRFMTPAMQELLQRSLRRIAADTAGMYGGSAETEFRANAAPLINDPKAAFEAQQTAAALFGRTQVITSRRASMAGDDMADLIARVPGVYGYVGSADPAQPLTSSPQHSDTFDFAEDAMIMSVCMHASYALDWLNDAFDGPLAK